LREKISLKNCHAQEIFFREKQLMQLNRRFTPLNLLMISINGMIGSAWLFAPLYAAKIAGPAAIVAWIIGGILTIIIALTFAELSVLFPVTGGSAQIPQVSHGPLTSFLISWIAWLSSLTMAPIEVQAILQYASTYFTSLIEIKNNVPILSYTGLAVATVLMLGFCFINIANYKGLIRLNFIIFTFKVAVIILAIFAIIHSQFYYANFNGLAEASFSLSGWHAILTAVASGGVAFAFTGFKHGVELAGETKKYAIAIPLAIIGSVVCCLILYLGLQIAFLGALDNHALSQGWAHIQFSGDVGPFAGLAAGLGLFWLVKLLYIDAVISPLGAGLIYATSTARILYAMSQLGYVPAWLSRLNKHQLPVAAIMLNFILGMLLFLPLPGWQAMVSFLVSGMVISYGMGPIALLCLRRQMPNEKRHFRLPAAHLMCVLAFTFCNLLCYWTSWETVWKLGVALIIGCVVFSSSCLKRKIPLASLGLQSIKWIIPYCTGLIIISYLGAFGGKNIIPFGWDFVVITLFSSVILFLAVSHRSVAITHDAIINPSTDFSI
jgi:amino acid transporter